MKCSTAELQQRQPRSLSYHYTRVLLAVRRVERASRWQRQAAQRYTTALEAQVAAEQLKRETQQRLTAEQQRTVGEKISRQMPACAAERGDPKHATQPPHAVTNARAAPQSNLLKAKATLQRFTALNSDLRREWCFRVVD